jgi:pimeloyl-ACP methyl ester carboxylesterase
MREGLAAGMTEDITTFASDGATVRGILHRPPGAVPDTAPGMVFLHGWSGCRLGPHRMFVTAARMLCADGIPCLRFDFRGRGESDGQTRAGTIRSMTDDACRAVDHLERELGTRPVLLLGICSGGKVAVAAAARDPRVQGLVLWSAEAMGDLRSRATDTRKSAFALRTYARKLVRPETWRKIFAGRVNVGLVHRAVLRHEGPDAEETRRESGILRTFRAFEGEILFVYGGNDPDTRLSAAGYRRFCADAGIRAEFHEIPEANHSFYSLTWEAEVIERTRQWLRQRTFAADTAPGGE